MPRTTTGLAKDGTAQPSDQAIVRNLAIGLIAFLTLVDLFAAQALLPSLARLYGVRPSDIGLAVNASTLGMAVAGLGVAVLGRSVDRRLGIVAALATLAVPTTLLAFAPDLTAFAALRIAQGLCMATAFTLTLAYLGEHCDSEAAAGAFAAYITGNVASNLFGRLLAASIADRLGVSTSFFALAALNLLGAALVYVSLKRGEAMLAMGGMPMMSPLSAWIAHARDARLRAAFAVGFCILFAFIGTFTYVNFVLVDTIGLSQMALGLVYLVFLPSIFTTPLAGRAVQQLGLRRAFWAAIVVAMLGLPPLLVPTLPAVIAGLVLVGVGTFFAQAIATSFVSRAATTNRAAASGIYLASYFLGGLIGSALLGHAYDRFGWAACVAGIASALALAALLAVRFRLMEQPLPHRAALTKPAGQPSRQHG